MSTIASRLRERGLVLPPPLVLPPGVTLPFPWVRVHGSRALVSGHGPQNPDGTLAGPFGRVGLEVSVVKPVRFQAKLAVNTSENSSFWFGDDSAAGNGFKVAPQIRLGATFYKTVSAYVGMNFPITAETRDGCTPDFWLGGEMVAGAKADIPFGSAVQAEFTSEPFFNKKVKEGKCQ